MRIFAVRVIKQPQLIQNVISEGRNQLFVIILIQGDPFGRYVPNCIVSLTDKAIGGLVIIRGKLRSLQKRKNKHKSGRRGQRLPLLEKPCTCSLCSGLSIVSATFRRFTRKLHSKNSINPVQTSTGQSLMFFFVSLK